MSRIHHPAAFYDVVNANGPRLTPAEMLRAADEMARLARWNDYRNALTRDGYTWDEAHQMTVAHFAAIDHQSADEAADAQQE